MPLPEGFPDAPIPPPPSVALFDAITGRISTDWYAYFQAKARFDRAVRERLEALTP